MKWDNLQITNTLLLIIAVLMLVLVAQQPRGYQPKNAPAPALQSMGSAPTVNPHASTPSMQGHDHVTSEEDGFNFQNMVFAALRCPEDGTITLADFGCTGSEASTRRTFVKALFDQGLPPRHMFDEIIDAFGLDALTDEAKEIRKTNRATN